jgi:RNA polymerase sigma factor (TIGR02999 family)
MYYIASQQVTLLLPWPNIQRYNGRVIEPANDITQLLNQLAGGNRAVVDALMPLVYDELHAIAQRQMRRERPGHTINTTALVHEAYLRLVDQREVSWQNRAHFLALAAQAMRRIMINYAQARLAEKRGGGEALVSFDDEMIAKEAKAEELIELDAALHRLQQLSDRQSQIVEMRFFGGLTHEEIAEALGISVPTVQRDWRMARAWLARELRRD